MAESLERLKAALADRYAIQWEIGSGWMATVYLARDLRPERQVSVRVLRPGGVDTVGSESFLQEVRVTADLQHPHILPLFHSWRSGRRATWRRSKWASVPPPLEAVVMSASKRTSPRFSESTLNRRERRMGTRESHRRPTAGAGLLVFLGLLASGCASEARQWERAKTTDSLSAYETFLAAYPEGVLADSARQAIEAIHFREARATNSLAGYETFLTAHSDGVYADSARQAIEAIHFEEARAANSIAGFHAFLVRYPEGEHAEQARQLVEPLYEARANRLFPISEVVYLNRPGKPRLLYTHVPQQGTNVLLNKDVARRNLVVDEETGREQLVFTDAVNGEVIHRTDLDADGRLRDPMMLCLDEGGNVLRRDGKPVLVRPFEVKVIMKRGDMMSFVQYDPYGRPERTTGSVWPCVNCSAQTGIADCAYVWYSMVGSQIAVERR